MAKLVRLGAVKRTVVVAGFSVLGTACGSDVNNNPASGGTGTGGARSSGGATSANGGAVASGGASQAGAAQAGTTQAGGSSSAGASSSAGSSAGGAPASGGSSSSSGGSAAAGAGGKAAGGGPAAGGQPGSGTLDGYNPDFKEDSGTACTLPEPMMLATADHKLPDPFKMPDGTRMSTLAQWTCQRAWLKKNVEAFVHGQKPAKPSTVTGTVSATSISIHVEEGGKSADFSIPIDRPSATGAVPGVFQADGSGVPASFLKSEGVAAMAYSHSAAEGAFNKLYSGAAVSPQIKWAWAVSRAIDVLVAEKAAGKNDVIDPIGLGTTGCSYAGKSAFTVGAFDERIALGMPMESGTGGLASYRVVNDNDKGPNAGEGPEPLNEACAKWFSSKFCSSKPDSLPVDAHFMVAMYAPRGFTILDNNRIGHLAPVASFAADAAGAEVFKALGIPSNVGYHGGNDTDPHAHCSWNTSQQETVKKAIAGFLTKKAAPANFMQPKLKDASDKPITLDLAKYIAWTTPTLK
jgi:(4-O-methyl)-D-glucuronate---lignin esterase